jgi:photosystem II stability/assembly factor-like uncharacterized protein
MFQTCIQILVSIWVGQLSLVDPAIHSDDFVSISCPQAANCYLLDQAGSLFFSPDGGHSRIVRNSLARHGINKIRFVGLLEGWGLDERGNVWRTRNGGRLFRRVQSASLFPKGMRFNDMLVDENGRLWLASLDGTVLRKQGAGPAVEVFKAYSARVVSMTVSKDGQQAAALFETGTLAVWSAAKKSLTRSKPLGVRALGVRALGVSFGRGRSLIVTGCRGRVRVSADGGRSWKDGGSKNTRPELVPSVCFRPLGLAPDGRVVLAGLPGKLVLTDPVKGELEVMDAPPTRHWREGAPVMGSLLVVGDGGALGRLEAKPNSPLHFVRISQNPDTIVDLRVFKNRKEMATRAFADGRLDLSQDGGQSWNPAKKLLTGQRLNRAQFFDPGTGFALLGVHEIHGLQPAGQGWQTLGRWADISLTDLFFLDRRHGWAVGQKGALLSTVDGGLNWTLSALATDRFLNRVVFVNAKQGFAVGAHQAIFRTQDGGKVWERLRNGRGSIMTIDFVDNKHGWVAGDQGLVMATGDGGDSWRACPVPTIETIRAIGFSDRLRGLVGGAGGLLYATRDGCHSWRKLPIHTRAGVTSIACFPKKGRCLVGGERGLLLLGDPFTWVD